MKKSKAFNIILIILTVVALAAAVVCGVPDIIPYEDALTGKLVSETIPRLAVGIVLVLWSSVYGYGEYIKPSVRGWGKTFLFSIPCFAVAVVNFPFSALLGGVAVIERADLIWLFLLKCFSIALMEEVFFRALLLPFSMERIGGKNKILLAVVFSSAVFGLVHFINLFFGAGIVSTLMQVGYTFLIGCMLAVLLLRTKNMWLCVAVHFIFDIGGMIVTDLGNGPFQDTVFWVLTAVVGALVAAYIVFALIKLIKSEQSEDNN